MVFAIFNKKMSIDGGYIWREIKMAEAKDQKKQKGNSKDKNKIEGKKQGFQPPGKNPKAFQQFSNPNKFSGGSQQNFKSFHRRSGK